MFPVVIILLIIEGFPGSRKEVLNSIVHQLDSMPQFSDVSFVGTCHSQASFLLPPIHPATHPSSIFQQQQMLLMYQVYHDGEAPHHSHAFMMLTISERVCEGLHEAHVTQI